VLILMTGLPGTGKTTVAGALARELQASVLSTDRIRAERPDPRRFTVREKSGVYERMFARASRSLAAGRRVILDGTFYLERLRRAGTALGRQAGVPVFLVEVTAPLPAVKRRMEQRLRAARGPAPAAFEVHGYIRRRFEPVRGRHFVVDTADPSSWKRDLALIANAMRVLETERRVIAPLRRSRPLRLIQTHISWVLLDGARAHKIKKPVRFSFVDYTTAARRLAYCRREIAANARFSSGLYVGVVPVRDDGGALSFGGPGRTVDHAVEMRELPQDARLDRMIASRRAGAGDIRRIAEALCDFHARAARAAPRYGTPRAVRAGFEHAFRLRALLERELGGGAAAALDGIRERVDGFLRAGAALLRERVREGRVRHCHGDLRMSNIFLEGRKVRIFDAIEFDPGLSATDVVADVAYLAMDLLACGRRGLSRTLVDEYIACSGDEGLRGVAGFYECYRALVRLLVESLALVDPAIPASRKTRRRRAARRYLKLADELARRL
jgi:aminoglycoside phosphotransferase family enzyme/predicted kinase